MRLFCAFAVFICVAAAGCVNPFRNPPAGLGKDAANGAAVGGAVGSTFGPVGKLVGEGVGALLATYLAYHTGHRRGRKSAVPNPLEIKKVNP